MSLEQMRLKPEEIEINIPRLLKACLKNVKWILIIAMIVAIILSSYKFIKDKEEYNSEIELMRDITEEQTEKVKETREEYYDIKFLSMIP